MSWEAILVGKEAERARSWVEAISRALAEAVDGPDSAAYSLRGAAARSLYFGYLHRALPDRGWDVLAMQLLANATDSLSSGFVPPALHEGFCGTAWVAEHLQRLIPDDTVLASVDVNAEIDQAVVSMFDTPYDEGEYYDLISGLCGITVYLAERLPRLQARIAFSRIVDRLAESAQRMSIGLTWWTAPHLLPPHQRASNPSGQFNVGLAHGAPAVLWTLARAHMAQIGARTAELGNGLIDWLLTLPSATSASSSFPASICSGGMVPTWPSRSAWCYGDPGTLIALQRGTLAFRRPDCTAMTLKLAKHAAMRPIEHTGVVDGGLCHGSAGLAMIWNRFWNHTREPLFRDAALTWYHHLLDQRVEQGGIGGVRSWQSNSIGADGRWMPDSSFLTGAVGIGLTLLAGLVPIEPAWDALIMTDLASRPSPRRSPTPRSGPL
jgi:lantibiotic modifying enzyme